MKKINNLIAGAIAFVAVIFIAMISINQPEHPYELSHDEALDTTLAMAEMEVYPEDVPMMLEDSASNHVFIDVRNPGEFIKGHIEGAKNIPVNSILKESSLEFFREKDSATTAILYGKDQIQANAPWMLLTQLGFNNIKVMKGGYEYYSTHSLDIYDMPAIPEYMIEEPMYDYQQVVEETPGIGDVKVETEGPEKVVPKRKKKERQVEGGC
ncbi:MAG: rhodanese-like domain-containing protein [Bacteroidales bacterium]|nr:rhodanese-like domain-containing protein [Bacteroidales bacterium]MCF8338923.1 rhodanese-like domain-containing protein [Bacteroidales bacterium]